MPAPSEEGAAAALETPAAVPSTESIRSPDEQSRADPPLVERSGRRRWARAVLTGLVLVAIGAAGAWAAMTVLRPAEDPSSSTDHSFVRVEQGTVGYSLELNTMAEWTQQPIGTNRAAGVVTEVIVKPGAEVTPGTILYTVDLRPVVVAAGAVPMFRPIGPGVTGDDVRQLQELLHSTGVYRGAIDGTVGDGTRRAIDSWQKRLGIPVTGVVETADVIFVPSLPARVTVDAAVVSRGATLSGGESVVRGLAPAPTFQIAVTEAQAAMMPAGTRVDVTAPEGQTWKGTTAEQVRSDEGAIDVRVEGPDGASICGSMCAQVPPAGKTSLASRIVLVENADSLVVPSAALVSNADGTLSVIDTKGRKVAVAVVASAKGMSVITGASKGLRVRVPGDGSVAR